jgi:hypothetical protein
LLREEGEERKMWIFGHQGKTREERASERYMGD